MHIVRKVTERGKEKREEFGTHKSMAAMPVRTGKPKAISSLYP